MLKALYNAFDRRRRPLREHHFLAFPDLGFAYARVPNAASDVVRRTLGKLVASPDLLPGKSGVPWIDGAELLTARQLQRRHPNLFVFTVLRDPLTRLAACYRRQIEDRSDLPDSWKMRGFEPNMSFRDFTIRICEIGDLTAENQYRSQTAILAYKGRFIPQFFVRFERLESDWFSLRQLLSDRGTVDIGGLPARVAPYRERDLRTSNTLDPWVFELVRRRYRHDFRNFYPDRLPPSGRDPGLVPTMAAASR